ncbi:MAG: DUF4145 domain-containing protein [Syntrophobacteraceae bacterium]
MIPYTAPGFKVEAFNCPFCGAYSNQIWSSHVVRVIPQYGNREVEQLQIAECAHCHRLTFWLEARMIYPLSGSAPQPNPDLPDEIKRDYEEARSIADLSPRGAAGLLRLAIQKLCEHLGESGDNLNTDIANLVKKGLPTQVQKALDIVRVIGNEAVHPGQIDLNDDPGIAQTLFSLVNMIAEKMITEPKQIDSLFASLPEGKREQIAKRDSKD